MYEITIGNIVREQKSDSSLYRLIPKVNTRHWMYVLGYITTRSVNQKHEVSKVVVLSLLIENPVRKSQLTWSIYISTKLHPQKVGTIEGWWFVSDLQVD